MHPDMFPLNRVEKNITMEDYDYQVSRFNFNLKNFELNFSFSTKRKNSKKARRHTLQVHAD